MFPSLRDSLARVGRWPRLLAAVACLLLAAVSALNAAHGATPHRHRPAPTVPVVVAARDLPAGHLLTAHDLQLAHWPATIRPPGSTTTVRRRAGQRLAGPIRAGEAVTATRTVGPSLTDGLARGVAAVPVGVADARAADLVRPGERVELLASPAAGLDGTDLSGAGLDGTGLGGTGTGGRARVTVVAPALLVLAVLTGDTADADEATGGASIVVAADAATTVDIARLSATSTFTAVPVSP